MFGRKNEDKKFDEMLKGEGAVTNTMMIIALARQRGVGPDTLMNDKVSSHWGTKTLGMPREQKPGKFSNPHLRDS